MSEVKIELEINGRKISEDEYSNAHNLMRASVEQLKGFRHTTPNRKALERDIEIMNWILSQPDASSRCEVFMEKRHCAEFGPRDRAEIMAELKWDWRK